MDETIGTLGIYICKQWTLHELKRKGYFCSKFTCVDRDKHMPTKHQILFCLLCISEPYFFITLKEHSGYNIVNVRLVERPLYL